MPLANGTCFPISQKLYRHLEAAHAEEEEEMSTIRADFSESRRNNTRGPTSTTFFGARLQDQQGDSSFVPLHGCNRQARVHARAHYYVTIATDVGNGSTASTRFRASDVAKTFSRDDRYSGKPQENLHRKLSLFKTSCELAEVSIDNDRLML